MFYRPDSGKSDGRADQHGDTIAVGWSDHRTVSSRAHRKNDQAWVEQKNGAIVRRLVGYGGFVGPEATAALARLYDVVRLHGNLFQLPFKLRDNTRIDQALSSAASAGRADAGAS